LVDSNDFQLESLLLNSIKLKDSMFDDDEEDEVDYYYYTVSDIYKSSDETSSSYSVNLGMNDSFHCKKIADIFQLDSNIESIIEEIEVRFKFDFKFK
jgi:hypothetical protein